VSVPVPVAPLLSLELQAIRRRAGKIGEQNGRRAISRTR